MAFIVEDGNGLDDSTSYISVATADEHHLDRGNSKWEDYSTAEKESSLIRASDYVDKRFGLRFVGWRKQKSQAMEWPRFDAFDADGFILNDADDVPRKLQRAIAEYALRAAICGVLAPDPLLPVPKQSMESGDA